MSDLLQEFVDSRSQRLGVDAAAGVIRGVKLLGLRSRNGRRYRETALADAVRLYEGAKVNVNHPKGHPLSPRDYQDRLGVICGVEFRPGEGLFGDLQFNPKHALSEQLLWDAEHAPHNVGLSHNVLARTAREGDETVVEAITQVQSIDLVADPATTRGLFEQADRVVAGRSAGDASPADVWESLTLEQIEHRRPDLLEALHQAHAAELERLQGQLDRLAEREALALRRARIVELLQEHGLPAPGGSQEAARQIVSDRFVEALMQAADDEVLRRLVEERAALVRSAHRWNGASRGGARPESRDQLAASLHGSGSRPRDAREFAAALRG